MATDVLATLTIGNAVRLLRERHKMSARALSREAGLSPSYVNKIEAGQLEPSLRAFARIAHVLGMTNPEITLLLAAEAHRAQAEVH